MIKNWKNAHKSVIYIQYNNNKEELLKLNNFRIFWGKLEYCLDDYSRTINENDYIVYDNGSIEIYTEEEFNKIFIKE